jgi:SnoaL-like domain
MNTEQSTEQRLSALETRLRAAEDQLEIIRLLSTYGPAVDSGSSQEAAALWIKEGTYDVGGVALWNTDQLVKMYDGEGHRALIHLGSAHLTATPQVTVNGDAAEAVAYSFVVLKRHKQDAWDFWRAAINHWKLARTVEGWRIVERFNRVLDGSKASHDTMRKALQQT